METIENNQKKSKVGRSRSLSPKSNSQIDEQMKNIQTLFNTNKFVLSYDLFKKFIEDVHGSDDVLAIARNYTDNVEGLLSMMNQIYRKANKTITTKITHINKKLEKHIFKN